MTVQGEYGSNFTAETFEDAAVKAKAAGYTVLDFTEDMNGENILVIAED
jgi:hypothetical protein